MEVHGVTTTKNRVGQPAFGELERNAGKLARSVLRGARGRKRSLAYSTGAKLDD
jgi:hypothetical protein